MKILTLIHEYPPVGGGGGRAAMDIARSLSARGHQVKILTAHHGVLARQEMDGEVEVYRLRSCRKEAYRAGLGAMACYVLTSFFKGLQIVRRWRPDVIHVHFAVPAGASAWLISLITGVPYVMTVQLGDVPGASPEKTDGWFRWIKPFTPPIWKHTNGIAAVSAWVKNLAFASYPVPITVIPNGVPYEDMNPGAIELHHPPNIIFAGRFVEQKNLPVLLDVLARIRDLAWTAVLAGNGKLFPAVEQKIRELGLDDRITLTGWITPAEVQEWNKKSDILFMPSLSEGLPLVGVAAMSMGLALVMSNAGGNVDLVHQDENGYLFEPSDRDSYECVLRELIGNPQKLFAFRERSRQLARQFDQEIITDQYEALFAKAYQGK